MTKRETNPSKLRVAGSNLTTRLDALFKRSIALMIALCAQWCTGLILVMDLGLDWNDYFPFALYYGIGFTAGVGVAIWRRIWWALAVQVIGLAIVLPDLIRHFQAS